MKNIFTQYNNGNVLIIGGVNTGKSSILYKLINECIENNENIHFIDGECELSKIYKKNKKMLSIATFTTKCERINEFLLNIPNNDTIIIDDLSIFSQEIIDTIYSFFKLKKHRFIICTNTPKDGIPFYKFDNVINLRTDLNYKNYIGYNSSLLEIGKAIVNKNTIIEYPVEKWMNDKFDDMCRFQ